MQERKNHRVMLLCIILCGMCIAGFVFMFLVNKGDMDLYQAHEWTNVEAVYKKSGSYTETHYYENENGETEEEERVRYKWYYEYEINGQVYDCVDKGKVSEEPFEREKIRTIMVAVDDNAVYLMYENEEAFKNAYHSRNKMLMFVWGMICLIVIFICLPRKRRRRR